MGSLHSKGQTPPNGNRVRISNRRDGVLIKSMLTLLFSLQTEGSSVEGDGAYVLPSKSRRKHPSLSFLTWMGRWDIRRGHLHPIKAKKSTGSETLKLKACVLHPGQLWNGQDRCGFQACLPAGAQGWDAVRGKQKLRDASAIMLSETSKM